MNQGINLDIAEKTVKLGVKSQFSQLIILMGLPGSGKSYVSSYLHDKYGFTILSGENITFALFGIEKCSGDEYTLTYKTLRQLAIKLLSGGYSVVIDGTNLKYIYRQQIYDEINCKSTKLMYLKVDDKTALSRISQRGVNCQNKKNIKSSISLDIFNKFKNQLEEPQPSENFITLKSDKDIYKNVDKIFGVK